MKTITVEHPLGTYTHTLDTDNDNFYVEVHGNHLFILVNTEPLAGFSAWTHYEVSDTVES